MTVLAIVFIVIPMIMIIARVVAAIGIAFERISGEPTADQVVRVAAPTTALRAVIAYENRKLLRNR
jgi:hypothetical protein